MDERTLIRQMKSGDRASFDQIYEKYHVPLFRSAYLICGNREDAEDVLQDTFVTCWLCIGQLRKEESFRYWIFRIMTQKKPLEKRIIDLSPVLILRLVGNTDIIELYMA